MDQDFLYRFNKTFEQNAALGPNFEETFPIVPATPKKQFLGLTVNSRFGIAAGPGINSNWISLYSRLGFDILTYKTVRLHERLAHPLPNFTFLDTDPSRLVANKPLIATNRRSKSLAFSTTGGSLGMPSSAPEFWQSDIQITKDLLLEGQVLIVSVVGTVLPNTTEKDFIQEFATLTAMAVDSGADIVEANLSCPNVGSEEGETFKDSELARKIGKAVKHAAGGRPVLLKIGYCDEDELRSLLSAVAGVVDGVVMINALSSKILDQEDEPFFGPSRSYAGAHGAGVFPFALDMVKRSTKIIESKRLDLRVIGVGGANTIERVDELLASGASAALVGSAALFLPALAISFKSARPDF